jgi:integrase/recombinase XerD
MTSCDKEFNQNEHALGYLTDFLCCLENEKRLASSSCTAYKTDISGFISWLNLARENVLAIDNRHINQYLYARMANGYKPSSNARLLASLKAFYRYLLVKKLVFSDPCFSITQPKIVAKNSSIIVPQDVERLMLAPDVENAIGLRDRAMLEVLYSTGISVSELISLRIALLNLKQASLKVVSSKDELRVVFLTEQCCHWLGLYLKEERKKAQKKDQNDWMFLSGRGLKMTRQTFWYRIKAYVAKSGLSDNISPQTLRRSFAAHILDSGVELRVVQQILGHKQEASTARYR